MKQGFYIKSAHFLNLVIIVFSAKHFDIFHITVPYYQYDKSYFKVHICDDEQGECGKTGNGRKKRSVNENGQQAQRMTVGPIEVVQTAHNQRLV